MKRIINLLAFSFIGLSLSAQINFGPSIAGTQNDINYLGTGYLAPFSEAMAFG